MAGLDYREHVKTFRCKRCARTQRILSRNSIGQGDLAWYYALDEITFQGLSSNMRTPILVLDKLRRGSRVFSYTEELEFRKEGQPLPMIEIDVCCICDGCLTLGEVKTSNRIEGGGKKEAKSLGKYREAANLLGARRFILATSATWSSQTKENALAAFTDLGIAVEFMERIDPLSVEAT